MDKGKIFSGMCAIASMFFGSNSEVIKFVFATLIFIGFDLLTGVIKAKYKGEFTAGQFEKGIFKKVMILVAISFCYFIDKFQIINAGICFESTIAVFFTAGELVSIMENLAECDVSFPKQIVSLINKKYQETACNDVTGGEDTNGK